MSSPTARWWFMAVLVAALSLRLTLALVLPYDAGPDERRRYDAILHMYQTGRAPRYPAETNDHYLIKPVLGYRISAYLAHLVPGDLPLFRKFRLGSVLVSGLAIACAYAAVRNLWPREHGMAVAITTMFAFHPQFLFIGSYFNADAYTVMVNTALFFLLAVIHRRGALQTATALALGAVLGLLFLGRENGYAGFLLAGGYGLYLWRAGRQNVRALAIALAVFLVFPTAFYLNQYRVYHRAYIPVVVGSGIAWVPPGLTVEQAAAQLPVEQMDYGVRHLRWTSASDWIAFVSFLFLSSFGVFGYMDIGLPSWWYSWYLFLVVSAGVGLVCSLGGCRRAVAADVRSRRWLLGSAAMAGAALVAIVVRHNFTVVFQPQGRYLMPMLLPALVLLHLGWRKLPLERSLPQFITWLATAFFAAGGCATVWLLVQYYA
ncbi:MAG: hypothetical protein PHI63_05115 [Patescibacteria group bacterium]|nr:hypothetical protein [Patescibacteria group bacterium]